MGLPSGSKSTIVSNLNAPWGVTLSADAASLYIAESGDNRITQVWLRVGEGDGSEGGGSGGSDGWGAEGVARAVRDRGSTAMMAAWLPPG